ncbi:MAG: hypothetical protein NZ805_10385 [Armatimonadetes bacterium]|nr:hypothetical protein [Armatimonadota bacterium]MDW8029023.1 hypothetical protein [Armatimonadota bacterium]
MITAADLTNLGKYAEAVRKFTEKVAQLPEVKVVKVNSCEDYVDLCVVVERSKRAQMTRKIVDIFWETWRQFPELLLDLMVTDSDYPTSSVEVYRRGTSDANNP